MQDFLLDSHGDLEIQNGDFVVGNSDTQNIDDIIQSFVGAWKQYPIMGVGIMQYLNSQNPAQAGTSIQQQLQADGFNVPSIKVSTVNGQLVVSFPNGISR